MGVWVDTGLSEAEQTVMVADEVLEWAVETDSAGREQFGQEPPELGVSFGAEDLVDPLLDALDRRDARSDALVARAA